MYTLAFELKGTSPLLMHADDVAESDKLEAWRKDQKNKNVSKAGDDRSPAWTWHSYLYSDGENVAMPSQNVMTCLRAAGAKKIMQRQKTYKEITQSGMRVLVEYLDFFCKGKKVPMTAIKAMRDMTFVEQMAAAEKMGFSLYCKRAKIGQSKHVRVRPRFKDWSIKGQCRVDAQELTPAVLTELFDLAGNVGLGDWRPGCKTPGPFGMFEATVKQV